MNGSYSQARSQNNLDGYPTPRFKTVLFDLDGTILDSAECGIVATQRAFKMHSLAVPEADRIVQLMGIPIEESFPKLAQRSLVGDALDALLKDFRLVYREITDTGLTVFSGMIDLLFNLKKYGVRLGIVTSKHSAVACRNMASVGIDLFFEIVIGPDMVQQPKPAPDTALAAMSALGETESSHVLVVGDACYDIIMGKAAGLSTCAVTWGAHNEADLARCDPSWISRSVDDLTHLLLGQITKSCPEEFRCV
ncbi:HAD family hydrolase [Sphingomonas sanguinis]|uniref:HAD family hydrolase n=1 Tax=Sphingomonas sanguinis TaxID=33051 RepID=UPI0009E68321|nr:HAD-IA family hydrolase [Sphingomonas sanguinis]